MHERIRKPTVDFHTMSANILQSVKLQFPKCTTGPFNKWIPEELRKRQRTQKAEDADLQITAEIMGARPRVQRRKVVANMKNQMPEYVSGSVSGAADGGDADGSGDAENLPASMTLPLPLSNAPPPPPRRRPSRRTGGTAEAAIPRVMCTGWNSTSPKPF